jgi:hypothetical protein
MSEEPSALKELLEMQRKQTELMSQQLEEM